MSFGVCVTKNADSFRADQAHGLRDGLDERLARPLEQQMRLVQEEDELRLIAIADLGKRLEKLRDDP